MRVFDNFSNISGIIKNPIVTIGNFDGVHKGHQYIFETINKRAADIGGESVVLTFEPHPLKLFSNQRKLFLLTPTKKKIVLIEKMGVDNLILLNFTRDFAELSAEEFVKRVIVDMIKPKEIFVGYNYYFGKDREGNVELFKKFGHKYGFEVNIIEPYIIDDKIVSSSLCRELISDGKVRDVSKFLGSYYLIEGVVVKGEGIGRKLGFPTANIKSPSEVYPKHGVYAVKVGYKNKIWDGACSLGFNPTFDSVRLTVETYIFDFDEQIYDQKLKIVFIDRIRDMLKFNSLDELVSEIKCDVEKARAILKDVKISLKEIKFWF